MPKRRRVTFGGSGKRTSFLITVRQMRSEKEVKKRLKMLENEIKRYKRQLEKSGFDERTLQDAAYVEIRLKEIQWVLCKGEKVKAPW